MRSRGSLAKTAVPSGTAHTSPVNRALRRVSQKAVGAWAKMPVACSWSRWRSLKVNASKYSIACVSLSRWLLSQGRDTLVLTNYELLKAFPGITTHDGEVAVPIVANSQDMTSLSQQVLTRLGMEPTRAAATVASSPSKISTRCPVSA